MEIVGQFPAPISDKAGRIDGGTAEIPEGEMKAFLVETGGAGEGKKRIGVIHAALILNCFNPKKIGGAVFAPPRVSFDCLFEIVGVVLARVNQFEFRLEVHEVTAEFRDVAFE